MALNLILDVQITPGGLVPNVIRDDKGRIKIAYGRIRGNMKVQGTSVSSNMRILLQNDCLPSDDIGHIIPKIWGGSGMHPNNLFPQNSMNNRASAWVEKDLAKKLAVDENSFITFCITFTYDDSSSSDDDDDDDWLNSKKIIKRRPKSYHARTKWRNCEESNEYSYEDNNWTYDASKTAKVVGSAAKAGSVVAASSLKGASNALKGAGPALRGISTAAVPVAATFDAINIFKAAKTGDPEKVVETAVDVGAGWGGAYGGASAGAAIGTALGPVGTVAGGAVGAVVGSIAASKVAKKAVNVFRLGNNVGRGGCFYY